MGPVVAVQWLVTVFLVAGETVLEPRRVYHVPGKKTAMVYGPGFVSTILAKTTRVSLIKGTPSSPFLGIGGGKVVFIVTGGVMAELSLEGVAGKAKKTNGNTVALARSGLANASVVKKDGWLTSSVDVVVSIDALARSVMGVGDYGEHVYFEGPIDLDPESDANALLLARVFASRGRLLPKSVQRQVMAEAGACCANCGKNGAKSMCATCGTPYCDRDCQKAHWKEHREPCKASVPTK